MPTNTPRRQKQRSRSVRRSRSAAAHLSLDNRYALFDLGWLHADPNLSLNELRVYLVLAAHADSDRGTCFPSRDTIAREANIGDRRAVGRALQGLEKKGAVVRNFRLRCTNLYDVVAPPMVEAVRRVYPVGGGRRPRDPGRNCPPEATTLSDQMKHG